MITWFQSYLENRTQIVTIHGKHLTSASLSWCTTVLGPILFILYLQSLSNVVKPYPVLHEVYADDTEICKSCTPSEIVDTIKMYRAVHFKCKDMDVPQQTAKQ